LIESTPSESWLVAQKILAFDEPRAKWLSVQRALRRLDKRLAAGALLRRTTPNISESTFDTLGSGLRELDYAHNAQILLEFIALEETSRYEPIALLNWYKRSHAKGDVHEETESGKSSNDSAWLTFMLGFSPMILAARDPQVNASDFLAYFVNQCLLRLEHMGHDTTHGVDRAYAILRQQIELHRGSLPGNFLPNFILLVEGATEAILLPRFAALLGFNLASSGAMLIPAGGANQVAKRYIYFKEIYSLPIFVLLDRDAETQSEVVQANLRNSDQVHVLADGEIEDILMPDNCVALLNRYIDSLPAVASESTPIRVEDFAAGKPRKKALEHLWRTRSLGKFDKVSFAKFIADELAPGNYPGAELSEDGQALIRKILVAGEIR